ncbi:MAG TPA: FadR family transcriptional regulator [Deltaproteobacteria bacterium]|nr:FadR family transcriptional regulator [Deltaproteobacteria bacterium]
MMKTSERIIHALVKDIFDERYKVGDALPSERDLASHFNAYRGSVREALKFLEGIGLVEINPRGKIRVRPFWEQGGIELLSIVFRPEVFKSLGTEWLVQVLSIRKLLWSIIVELISSLNDKEKLYSKRDLLLNDMPTTGDQVSWIRYDFDFFRSLARMYRVQSLTWMLNSLGPVYTSLIPVFAKYLDVSHLKDMYPQILDMALEGNAQEARNLVLERFDIVDAALVRLAQG